MNFEHIIRKDKLGGVIGDLEWRESPGATYELHLDVHPKFHRQGIGRSMVDELEKLALEKGAMILFSYSSYDNELAYKFFMGLEFSGYYLKNFYGTGRDAYLWVKTIGAPK